MMEGSCGIVTLTELVVLRLSTEAYAANICGGSVTLTMHGNNEHVNLYSTHRSKRFSESVSSQALNQVKNHLGTVILGTRLTFNHRFIYISPSSPPYNYNCSFTRLLKKGCGVPIVVKTNK